MHVGSRAEMLDAKCNLLRRCISLPLLLSGECDGLVLCNVTEALKGAFVREELVKLQGISDSVTIRFCDLWDFIIVLPIPDALS